MSHTRTNENERIRLGSMAFYVTEWTGTIPSDADLEKEENLLGRTKNGATIGYSAEWYTVKSDDGKAQKSKLVGETVTINYGNITFNMKTIEALTATARVEEKDGKRIAKIGGLANDNGKRYLIRGVHTDKVDGDVRITGVGVNTGGWSNVYQNNQETILQPNFTCEPMDKDGTLLEYEEEILGDNSAMIAGKTSTPVKNISQTGEK